ncbi:caspase activity and apoptosis inhibitor 1 [Holotrichia oblita]|uniref:Caspase activity and apoptosis inhibitor 1 n=1 Tax=Holotrichia oblita TaxID=644536 RepID=A0ACB9SZI9_HOLOL|nr:caspase activity and apoptosis inhibitor 1 [Holotrichia oblita]
MSLTKQKSKKVNLTSNDSGDESEHELFYYANDRIKLMKEVLKLIKPKKIKAIAPDVMKDLDIDEINSILLEELLGISNKRLKHILNGDNFDTVSTSSESETEQQPIDIISLDDISDTDDDFGLASVNTNNEDSKGIKIKKKIHKEKKKVKEIKKETGQSSKTKDTNPVEKVISDNENDKLMNVLEILELQARARAIRSQLALENINKKRASTENTTKAIDDDDDDHAIIISSPKNEEIVITSSESEDEGNNKKEQQLNIIEKEIDGNRQENDFNKDRDKDSNKIEDKNQTSNTEKNNLSDKEGEALEQAVEKDKIVADESLEKSDKSQIQEKNILNTTDDKNKKNYIEDKNDAAYKSDSDNDVINLDSEDIENV